MVAVPDDMIAATVSSRYCFTIVMQSPPNSGISADVAVCAPVPTLIKAVVVPALQTLTALLLVAIVADELVVVPAIEVLAPPIDTTSLTIISDFPFLLVY
jgi:hypothetical protein